MKALASLILVCLLGYAPVLASEFPEPPLEWVLNFQTEEIPGKAALYYDIDDDGWADLVTAHTLIKIMRVTECPHHATRIADEILIGSECDTRSPKVYVLERKIFAVRMVDEKWTMVIERTWRRCVDKDYATLKCRREEENITLVPEGD